MRKDMIGCPAGSSSFSRLAVCFLPVLLIQYRSANVEALRHPPHSHQLWPVASQAEAHNKPGSSPPNAVIAYLARARSKEWLLLA